MTINTRVGARAVCGLLAVALATAACHRGGDAALKVRTAPGQPDTSITVAPTPAPPETVTTGAAPAPSKRIREAAASRATPRVASVASAVLTKADTGLTRVRVIIDNHAAWTSMTLDGANILTGQVIETTGTRVTSMGPTISVADPGRAVLDFVLKIAPGAVTGISMCKNYLAPASISVTRLTGITAQVATVTNTGTDSTNTAGCENPMHVDIDRASLIGPVRWPARQDARPLVLANYYPWYDDTNVGKDYGDNPVGPVDTVKPDVVASAIGLAASKGIDGFIVEYEGTPANEPRIDTAYRLADARRDFSMALMLDLAIMKYRSHGISDSTLDAALHAIATRAHNPSQLLKNGQPVMFIYGADKIDASQWQAALTRQRAAGFTPFVVADDARLASPGRYSYSTNGAPDLTALLRWAASTLFDFRAQPGLTGQAGPLWVAPVSPGYDDRRLHRPNPLYVDRQAGQRYTDSYAAAIAALPDWLMVTSWNEYYEQTHIMPGTATGTRALEQTAAMAAEFHTTG